MSAATNRGARARFALAGEAWAYMAALWRSDWAAASQILAVFQQDFTGYRSYVAAGYPSGAPSSLPRTLSANGAFTPDTRLAMAAVLLVGPLGQNQGRANALRTFPAAASALGGWWNQNLVPLYPSDGSQEAQNLWAFDRAVRYGNTSEAGANVSTHAFAVIEGITSDGSDFIRQQANAGAQEIIQQAASGKPQANQAANQITDQPGAVTALPGSLVTAIRPERRSEWGFYVAGAVVLAGAVGLGFLLYKRRRKR